MKLEFIILLGILLVALKTDLKSHLINNKLSLLGFVVGVILSLFNDPSNILISLIVSFIYFYILFYVPRRIGISEFIGAGDIKLYMVVAFIMGAKFSIYTFIYSILIGTPMLILLNFKRLKEISNNVCFFFMISKEDIKEKIDNQKANAFSPYILIGSIVTYVQLHIFINDWLFNSINNLLIH